MVNSAEEPVLIATPVMPDTAFQIHAVSKEDGWTAQRSIRAALKIGLVSLETIAYERFVFQNEIVEHVRSAIRNGEPDIFTILTTARSLNMPIQNSTSSKAVASRESPIQTAPLFRLGAAK